MPSSRFRFSGTDQHIRAKLFGIGSAGCSIIEGSSLPTVAFSTSDADLARSHADRKFGMSLDRLASLAGAESTIMKLLPSIAGHELLDLFNNTDAAFMMSGLGGMTGSLGSKVFSLVARAKGVVCVSLVTFPFSAESLRRREMADRSMGPILKNSDLCLVFDNDKLSSLAPNLQLSRAFSLLNGIMMRPVKDLCSIMGRSDVHAFKQAVDGCPYARFGLGLAGGDDRVRRVVEEAMSSPWFDYDPAEADAVVAVYCSADPWDKEADSILKELEMRMTSARLLWGSYADPSLGQRVRLSLVLCKSGKDLPFVRRS